MKHTLMVLCVFAAAIPRIGAGASFNCDKAQTRIEKMICGDPMLSIRDDMMDAHYQELRALTDDPTQLVREQRRWLEQRNQCKDQDCLSASYRLRIAQLQEQAVKRVLAQQGLPASAATTTDIPDHTPNESVRDGLDFEGVFATPKPANSYTYNGVSLGDSYADAIEKLKAPGVTIQHGILDRPETWYRHMQFIEGSGADFPGFIGCPIGAPLHNRSPCKVTSIFGGATSLYQSNLQVIRLQVEEAFVPAIREEMGIPVDRDR